jgi:transcriptional regulator with XRE-family HTH domain
VDDFGARLKAERLRLGYTQNQFSALGGVAVNAQHMYETGKRMPKASYLTAISRGGADLMYICSGTRSSIAEEALTAREAEAVSYYRVLERHEQQAVLQILQSLAALRSDI